DCFWVTDPGPGFAAAAELVTTLAHKATDRIRAPKYARGVPAQRTRGARPRSILFLCYGNICRSAFAERYWNDKLRAFEPALPLAHSAGFVKEPDRETPPAIARLVREAFDVDLGASRSRYVTEADVNSADVIFVMDGDNYRALDRMFPYAVGKTFLLGGLDDPLRLTIADPYDMVDPGDVRRVFDRIARATRAYRASLDRDAVIGRS
ncbi:MAG: hypothetical protein JO104_10535, partial [Candidatus Eremiobacteraeota bacterium]|nr:hypothetical protein [Candidatus Eremiobacteraeota bacterium]